MGGVFFIFGAIWSLCNLFAFLFLNIFLRKLGMLYRRLRDFSIDVIKMAADIESEMRSPLSDSEANMGSTMSLKEEVEPFDERESGMDSAIEINETIKEKKDI